LLVRFGEPVCITVPNLVPIGQIMTEIWPFFSFLKMAAVRHLGFIRIWNFICRSVLEGQPASPCQIYCQSDKPLWSYGPFSIFQDGGHPPSCIFKSTKFSVPMWFRVPICVNLPKFMQIGQTIAEIWQFFDFSRWRPSAILDLYYACLDHPRCVVGGLYRCAKFGWNRPCSFEDMRVLMLHEFGLNAYSCLFGGFWRLKMRENGKCFQFYPAWDGITLDWHSVIAIYEFMTRL